MLPLVLKKKQLLNQKSAGFILSGAGAGLIIASFLIPKGALESGICIGLYCDEKYKNDGIKSAFLIAGTVTDMDKDLHSYAKELLDAGKVNEIWYVLFADY